MPTDESQHKPTVYFRAYMETDIFCICSEPIIIFKFKHVIKSLAFVIITDPLTHYISHSFTPELPEEDDLLTLVFCILHSFCWTPIPLYKTVDHTCILSLLLKIMNDTKVFHLLVLLFEELHTSDRSTVLCFMFQSKFIFIYLWLIYSHFQ
jgi:hypothetical protein